MSAASPGLVNAGSADRAWLRPGGVRTEPAPETLRLYAGDWARFAQFCAERGEPALPAAADLVIAFLQQPGAGRAALTRRLAAIDHKHRQLGLTPPGHDPAVRAAIRTVRKSAPRAKLRALHSAARLQELAQSCPGDLAGCRDRALLLLAASGLGHAALVGLSAERARFIEHGVTLVVEGARAATREIQVPRSAALASCPVRALEDWLRVSATRFGPVFRKVNRWGGLEDAALGTDAVRLILARRTAAWRPGRTPR